MNFLLNEDNKMQLRAKVNRKNYTITNSWSVKMNETGEMIQIGLIDYLEILPRFYKYIFYQFDICDYFMDYGLSRVARLGNHENEYIS